jgi:hypothetical protein
MTEVVQFKTTYLPDDPGPKKTQLPADYDPEKGLLAASMAEAAEKHFARAKDAEALYKAIEVKIDAQAEYIVWRDSVMKVKDESVDRDADSGQFTVVAKGRKPQLPASDPGKDVAYRWRERFTMAQSGDGKTVTIPDPMKIEEAKRGAKERCRQICEQEGGRMSGEPLPPRSAEDLAWIGMAQTIAANEGFKGDAIKISDNAKIGKVQKIKKGKGRKSEHSVWIEARVFVKA